MSDDADNRNVLPPVSGPVTDPVSDPVTAPELKKKGRAGRVALLALGLAGVVGGGAFAFTQITGGEKANTPEQAVEGFYRSFERGDFIGMSKALAPGERDVLLDSMVPMVAELSRLEILKKDFTLDKVDGYTAKVTNYKATSKMLRPDLASVVVTGGNLKATLDPKKLPFGDFLRDQFGKQIDEAESTSTSESLRVGTNDSPLIVQKVGKRWYISGNYSVAEAARRDSDNPSKVPAKGAGVAAKGSKTPEGAVRDMLQASANLDVRRVIELLPPDEFAALHDYAGEFIGDAERELADVRKQYTLTVNPKLTVLTLADDRRLVQLVDLPMKFSATVNEQRIKFEYKDKTATASFVSKEGEDLSADFRGDCLTIVLDGEKKKGCGREGWSKLFTDLTGTPIDLSTIPASTNGIAGPCGSQKRPQLGFTVIKRDGLWYVSPFRTTLDTMTATMKTLERKDLDCFVKEVKKVADSTTNSVSSTFDVGSDDTAIMEDTFSTDTFSADTSSDVFASDTSGSSASDSDAVVPELIADTPACREVQDYGKKNEVPPDALYEKCFEEAFGELDPPVAPAT